MKGDIEKSWAFDEVEGITVNATDTLQEAAEAYMVRLFEDSIFCAVHANRKTVFGKDM